MGPKVRWSSRIVKFFGGLARFFPTSRLLGIPSYYWFPGYYLITKKAPPAGCSQKVREQELDWGRRVGRVKFPDHLFQNQGRDIRFLKSP